MCELSNSSNIRVAIVSTVRLMVKRVLLPFGYYFYMRISEDAKCECINWRLKIFVQVNLTCGGLFGGRQALTLLSLKKLEILYYSTL